MWKKSVIEVLLILMLALHASGGDNKQGVQIDFFGNRITVEEGDAFVKGAFSAQTVMDIKKVRDKFSSMDFKALVKELYIMKDDMKLNDWGYLQLMKSLAAVVYPTSENGANYFIWSLLEESGYEVEAAFSNNSLYLLIPAKETIYGTKFSVINGKRYYNFTLAESRPLSQEFYMFPGSEKTGRMFSLVLDQYPEFPGNTYWNTLRFSDGDVDYEIDGHYDQQVIDFLKKYPQTEFPVYYNAPWHDELFLEDLRSLLKGKNEKEAVNILLKFMHQAFEYSTDEDQFGYEKVFFPMEMLYYEKSDCEDRTIFFAKLVKSLTGLDVIGLEYPSHMAAGVKFNENIEGDHVIFRGGKYLICDPSYVNASVGMSMPGLGGSGIRIIQFN